MWERGTLVGGCFSSSSIDYGLTNIMNFCVPAASAQTRMACHTCTVCSSTASMPCSNSFNSGSKCPIQQKHIGLHILSCVTTKPPAAICWLQRLEFWLIRWCSGSVPYSSPFPVLLCPTQHNFLLSIGLLLLKLICLNSSVEGGTIFLSELLIMMFTVWHFLVELSLLYFFANYLLLI